MAPTLPPRLVKPEMAPGPGRDFVEVLFALYDLALRPSARKIADKIKEMAPRGTASYETVRRMLNGTIVNSSLTTVEAVVLALCDIAGCDPSEEVTVMTGWTPVVSTRMEAILNAWRRVLDAGGNCATATYRTATPALEAPNPNASYVSGQAQGPAFTSFSHPSSPPETRTSSVHAPPEEHQMHSPPWWSAIGETSLRPPPQPDLGSVASADRLRPVTGHSAPPPPPSLRQAEYEQIYRADQQQGRQGVPIDMPTTDTLPAGAHRELVVALHELHSRAGRPGTWSISGLTKRLEPAREVSPTQVDALLRGTELAEMVTVAAVVQVLASCCATADHEVDLELYRFGQLWKAAAAPRPPSLSDFISSDGNMADRRTVLYAGPGPAQESVPTSVT
ncbi:hypothetical protein [Catenulispora rubra]|uniref:hypothetical protein n=1 Tax=Catenulispora rubra TaxID=280293 RepID=UPI0018925904|nr:hypothetical protein [Catenulispora rubra]